MDDVHNWVYLAVHNWVLCFVLDGTKEKLHPRTNGESFNSERSIPQIDLVQTQPSTLEAAPDSTESEVQHANSTAILTTEGSLLLESQKTSSLKSLECTEIEPCRDSLASPTIMELPDQMEEPQHEQINRISVENQGLSCSRPNTQTKTFPTNETLENQIPEMDPRTNNTEGPSATPESAPETTARVPLPSETPQKHPLEAALGVMVPSPFKKSLFWPEEEPKEKKKKKEKIPFAVTSKSWQEYHRKKEIEKQNLQKEKEKRALERQQKKILKEKGIAEKKGKSKSKPKTKHREDTSSEDTDAEIVYAESDDSVSSNSAISRENPQDPQPSKRRKIPITKQGIKTSKRPRKNLECNNTDSDDEPLSSLTTNTNSGLVVAKGQYVIVKYEGEYFPGKTEDVDRNQYEVSTMILSTGNSFRWPDKPDKIWYNAGDVVELINIPLPLNNRGFYKIKEMEKYLPNIYT